MDMETRPEAEREMPDKAPAIGPEQLKQFTAILQKYKAGKAQTESRIIASENWWKLRNTTQEQRVSAIGKDGGFTSTSGWLHNVIVSKHADAMESFPEPNILPREEGDKAEAKKLTSILPCILEQNQFESTYSDVMWQKLKTGTGVYKVVWDSGKLGGLGDISVSRVNLLNVYWEPGITDIQKSRFLFHTQLQDRDLLEERYPQLKDKLKSTGFVSAKFLYDDTVSTEGKHTVIDVYYRKYINGRSTLQYCKYVADQVLYATEDTELRERGLYDHVMYPYVFDALYPIEGSPCGYGYVDICRNPQTEIDLLKTSFVKNAMVGATPRYFKRTDGGINTEQFLDLSNPLVDVNGNMGEDAIRQIDFSPLDGIYVSVLDRTIDELRQTSGNTETSTGSTSSGVTAASAIAALQEASGKGSRDSTQTSYRAFTRIVDLCIELVRQFYDMSRQFRIIGEYGAQEFIRYDNRGIQPQHQGSAFGQDMGYRLPVFDIKVSAQKKNVYTKVSQNELALQFFQLGFFNPQMTDQALMCLEMMDFDGKDQIMQKVSQNGTLQDKLMQYMQISLMLAQSIRPDIAETVSRDIVQTMGATPAPVSAGPVNMTESDNIAGIRQEEHSRVRAARSRANAASQPGGGEVTKEDAR